MHESTFQRLFDAAPSVRASAPGRVNLIGDHTDYNGGFVLPVAIPQHTSVELRRREGRTVRAWSASFADQGVLEYALGSETPGGTWIDYVKGMTWVLRDAGVGGGLDIRIQSDVPLGSGLASSAALEIAVGRGLREAFGIGMDDVTLARAARRAEHDFVGAPVGIMDQMACSLASTSTALFLDTRSLEFARVPLPAASALIVIDSGVAHKHAGGSYSERRRECKEAAALLNVPELRDVSAAMLAEAALPAALARRVRHVVTENTRVLAVVEALRSWEPDRAGELFAASHRSMRDDFEVSIPAVDVLVDIAARQQGVYGARLTGGGFGGAVVALASADRAAAAASRIVSAYVEATGNPGRVVVPPEREGPRKET